MAKFFASQLLWKKLFANAAIAILTTPRPAQAAVERKYKLAFTNAPSSVSSETEFYVGLKFHLTILSAFALLSIAWDEARAGRFSINDAISQAVLTNPGVGEASANRRATETELRQTRPLIRGRTMRSSQSNIIVCSNETTCAKRGKNDTACGGSVIYRTNNPPTPLASVAQRHTLSAKNTPLR